MKIAIIVLCGGRDIAHSNGKTYDDLVDSVKETWAKELPDNVDVFYNYGIIPNFEDNPKIGETKIHKNLLLHGIDETYENMNKKVLNSFSYFANNTDYDFVFRCCCGSYINISNLLNFLKDKPKNNFYCGIPTHYNYKNEDFHFASGSGFFFSNDLLKIIGDNLEKMIEEEVKLDDVTIGYHFKNFGIKIHPGAKRRDIGDLPDTKDDLVNLECLEKSDFSHYHFHIRHNPLGMKKLHYLITKKIFCGA